MAGQASPYPYGLQPSLTEGAQIHPTGPQTWRLSIPAGPSGRYRLAQLDDYGDRPRRAFPRRAPFQASLRVRASARSIPGTWGFGVWNDPFSMSILHGVEKLRLPVFPNAAWFFFASPPNHLSLRDDLPAQGWLAATFAAPRWPSWLSILGGPALPFSVLPPVVRLLRRLGRGLVRQDARKIAADPTDWHNLHLEWQPDAVRFQVDGEWLLETSIQPQGPQGFVLWIDNQFAALPPDGRVRVGTLANSEPAWIEIADLEVSD